MRFTNCIELSKSIMVCHMKKGLLTLEPVLKQNKIPFGPSISIAAFITMLSGDGIVSWYLSLF